MVHHDLHHGVVKFIRIYLVVVLVGVLVCGMGCKSRKPRVEFVKYTHPDSLFSVEIRSDWKAETETLTNQYSIPGVQFLSPPHPKDKPQILHSIDISFYPRGNYLFGNPEHYISTHTSPRPGHTIGPVTDTNVGDIPAKQFRRFEPLPGGPEFRPEGILKQHTIVFPVSGRFYELSHPASEVEFFVIWYAAPEAEFDKSNPIFEHVIKTFNDIRKSH